MKQIKRFLLAVLCAAPFGGANAAPIATTSGSNLTAYNPNVSLTGNQWVTAMNPRNLNSGQKVEADFGNCNALILRCAQPKCSGTGCADANVATSIVTGCIQANDTCKQYADQGLTEYIVAQLVASSSAKANDAAIAAQAAAAAQQSSQQLQQMQNQMQMQMQQMQSEMANQNAATIAELKNALEEQKALNAAAQQPAQPVQNDSGSGLSTAQQIAAANNVSADIVVREQVSGEILTSIENAEVQLKTLKATMYQPGGTSIFTYAGCDSTGSNCTGPKRVRRFKELANGFFDPYNSVLDEMYDALITAQSVGVDVTDIYMMLNDSCNQWGQYLCSQRAEFTVEETKDSGGNVISIKRTPKTLSPGEQKPVYSYYDNGNCPDGTSKKDGVAKGGHECTVGMVIPPEDDMYCTLQKTLSEKDGDIQRQWLYADQGDLGDNVRVGCASSALDSVALFRNRKKKSNLDVETLQRMINQDAPATCYKNDKQECPYWCKATDPQYLIGITTSKSLGEKICLKSKPTETYSSSLTKCQDDEDGGTPYVDPRFALCSVHAYNIGETDNKKLDSTNRTNMNDIIALKATVITQQMYKQYEYLESMIKRFKTQLKKAVLTAKVQMVNGDNSSSSSTGSSSGYNSNIDRRNGVYLAEAKNCGEEIETKDILNCLLSNYDAINSEYKKSSMSSDLKKQLAADHNVVKNVLSTILVPSDYQGSCLYGTKTATKVEEDTACVDVKSISSTKKFGECLTKLRTYITKAQNCYDLSQRQFQTK